jgi:peroxiredoxin family protein
MKPNPIVLRMSKIEKQFFEWYKKFNPSLAYTEGINECAGKFFIPSRQNLMNAEKKLKNILKKAQNEVQRTVFKSYLTLLRFNEPYMIPSRATDAFFAHLVKEGIVSEHLISLAKEVEEALDAYIKLLAEKQWPIEIKILTCQITDQLLGLLDSIHAETEDENLRKSLNSLKENALRYRKLYQVRDIKHGDFSEVYPILQKTRKKIKHKILYSKLLADLWGYPEKPEEIEKKAELWLKKELRGFQKVTLKLAKIYGVKPTVEIVNEELNRRRGIPRQQTLQFLQEMRLLAKKVFEENIVKVTPKYEIRVMETPPYLCRMIPTAAMISFDTLTDKPFSVFLITTDSRFSPSSSIPELVNSLVHEEYGHAVNFSNSATRFAAKPTFLEILSSNFSTHISEGISFHREFEFLRMLKKLAKKKTLSNEEAFLKLLKGKTSTETMLLENEFVTRKWRIIRFLRTIFDVRINMGKQSVPDFVEWAHKETGLSEKTIYDQTWMFLEFVGYAPCYSIACDMIRKLQERALKKGINLLDFNTYASSLGFPARKIFEQKIIEFINKRTSI